MENMKKPINYHIQTYKSTFNPIDMEKQIFLILSYQKWNT